MYVQLLILISFCIGLLSMVTFLIMLYRYFRGKEKRYHMHALARLFAVLTFFLFIDGAYNTLFYLSQYGFVSQNLFFRLSDLNIQIIPKLGIFLSAISIIHFIMENRLEDIRDKEESFEKLEKLNHELDKRARELEQSQENLQKKVIELEKFNEIAKEREHRMISTIKKIEKLEGKIKK